MIIVKMCEQCFVQAENYSKKSYLPVMKEGSTFNKVSISSLSVTARVDENGSLK